MTNWKTQIRNLLFSGTLEGEINEPPEVSETQQEEVINLLLMAAKEEPDFLLEEVLMAVDNGATGMITIALAALLGGSPDHFLNDVNYKNPLVSILYYLGPEDLLEITELLKHKIFGRGLGSRSQKIIRRIIEGWSRKTLYNFIQLQPDSLYSLIKIIHPRYNDDDRGGLIKEFLAKTKKKIYASRDILM